MLKARHGTMDADILSEISRDPYFVTDHVTDGDIVVDCGANIGAFANYVLNMAPNATVICIEPMPSNITALEDNMKDARGCRIIHAALMGRSGVVDMHDFGDEASACHSIYNLGDEKAAKVEVPALTLSQIMDSEAVDHIDFMKLDVQGAEYEIIPSCSTEVLGKINYISMELHCGISKTGTVIGYIPFAEQKITAFIEHLSQTHVIVLGWPRRNAMLLWKNRRNASRAQCLVSYIKKSLLPVAFIFQNSADNIKRFMPPSFKRLVVRIVQS